MELHDRLCFRVGSLEADFEMEICRQGVYWGCSQVSHLQEKGRKLICSEGEAGLQGSPLS